MEKKHPSSSQREALELLIKEYYEKMMRYRTESEEKTEPVPENTATEDMPPNPTDTVVWEDSSVVYEENPAPAEKELPDFFSSWIDMDLSTPAKEEPVFVPESMPAAVQKEKPITDLAVNGEEDPKLIRNISPMDTADLLQMVHTAQSAPPPRIFFDKGRVFSGTFQPYHSFSDHTALPMMKDPSFSYSVYLKIADFGGDSIYSPIGITAAWPDSGYTLQFLDRERSLTADPATVLPVLTALSAVCAGKERFWESMGKDPMTTPYLIESAAKENSTVFRTPYTTLWEKGDTKTMVRYLLRPDKSADLAHITPSALGDAVNAEPVTMILSAQMVEYMDESSPAMLDPTYLWDLQEFPSVDLGVIRLQKEISETKDLLGDPLATVTGATPVPDPFTAAMLTAGNISDRHRGMASHRPHNVSVLNSSFAVGNDGVSQMSAYMKDLSDDEVEQIARKLAKDLYSLSLRTLDPLLKNFDTVDHRLRKYTEKHLRQGNS